jgi:hypothetical protein
MELITATTTIMAGITVGTTTDIGMRGVGRTTDNPVGQISARLRASRAFFVTTLWRIQERQYP